MLDMTRDEMLAALRAERLAATQRIMVLRREIRQRQDEIDQLDVRLDDINHAEGLL